MPSSSAAAEKPAEAQMRRISPGSRPLSRAASSSDTVSDGVGNRSSMYP